MRTVSRSFWPRFDEAHWRGELLRLGSEINGAGLRGLDYQVAKVVFQVEAGTIDPTSPEIVALVDELHDGPSDHASRAARAYAQASFFIGNWQNCLDGLQMAAVTVLRRPDGTSHTFRRLRTEAYLGLVDVWIALREPGVATQYLALARAALGRPSARISARLRRICSTLGGAGAALLQLGEQLRWRELFERIANRNSDSLPAAAWPAAPDPSSIRIAEGARAAYETCLAQSACAADRHSLDWAQQSVRIATTMKAPAWIAHADLAVARTAARWGTHELASFHVARAVELIRSNQYEGLLIDAMLANMPLQARDGTISALEQSSQAMVQVLGLAAVFRDPVLRRRFVWAHEEVFTQALTNALAARDEHAALLAILNGSGWGWHCSGGERVPVSELEEARHKETGPRLPSERVAGLKTMRNAVVGPAPSDGAGGGIGSRVEISDSLARAETLQLVRERALGAGRHREGPPPEIPEATAQIHFWTQDREVRRICRWRHGMHVGSVAVTADAIRTALHKSGLSASYANRSGPVDFAPLEALVRRLIDRLPSAVTGAKSLRIWPHGLLHSIPFAATVATSLAGRPSVSIVLTIERRPEIPKRFGAPVRMAPAYRAPATLRFAEAEVSACAQAAERIIAGQRLRTAAILRTLGNSPSLFHFAGHAVNRNDLPELAGLYDSELEILSVSDILNLGYFGPRAVVLSACETGPGALHSADGSYSLPRAFLQTGADWVVASLWRVGDRETFDTMQAFFRDLARGLEPEQALPSDQRAFVLYRPGHAERMPPG